ASQLLLRTLLRFRSGRSRRRAPAGVRFLALGGFQVRPSSFSHVGNGRFFFLGHRGPPLRLRQLGFYSRRPGPCATGGLASHPSPTSLKNLADSSGGVGLM